MDVEPRPATGSEIGGETQPGVLPGETILEHDGETGQRAAVGAETPAVTGAPRPPPSRFAHAPGTAPQPPEVASAPSESQFGKFVRTEKLGAGGMGEVWRAYDTQLGRWVALKSLKGGDEDLARFKREAHLAGQLSHPNICAIHEVGEDRGQHFIAMQFVPGETLRQIVAARGADRGADRRLLVRLIRDTARAVDYAHGHVIVHRDLKPENLMVTEAAREPHVYVMDFGLARSTVDATLGK